MKVSKLRLGRLVIAGGFLLWGALALGSNDGSGVAADEALQRLLDGNKRYVESKMKACGEANAAAREKLANTQKPYAIILSCSDSRVPPEIIFDKGLGEIFVVRVAGNVPDPIILGSIEYAVEHLGSTLVMVLGHERCGAVMSAVDAKGKPEGNIGAIIKAIAPAVKQAKTEYKGKEKAELIETAINGNVKLVAANLTKQSSILGHFVEQGKVKIVAAKYDLDAYKGKWHLTKEFETVNELGMPTKIFTKEMEAYGFSDYFGVVDIIAHEQGGYLHDGIISAMGVNWLRGRGMELAVQRKPWFLAVNLVNPHDVMFINTDRPGERVQARNILGHIMPEPGSPFYSKQWTFNLPETYAQRLDAPGRPAAHTDYLESHDALVGNIPNEDWRWRRRHNYYLNCLRDVDRNIVPLLDELEALGLASKTIVVLTSDHGELDGAHRLHSKGATSYREQNNVPLIVVHPAYPGGKRCKAVTSHLDIAPTLVGLTNANPDKKAAITKNLPGKDFSLLLVAPEKAGHGAIRDGVLYCYNMFAYIDGDFLKRVVGILQQPDGKAKVQGVAKKGELRPSLMKRGAIRSVFDGRYQFTRYFSPKQHNRPNSTEALFKLNDVELFDLEAEPHEINNLAIDRKKSEDLLEAMNAKLNALLDAEVGEDVGQMLPGGVDGGWAVSNATWDL